MLSTEAFQSNREVVPVTQRDDAVEEPGFGDVYEVGVLARLLELERFPDGTTMIIQAHRRVVIYPFMGKVGAFQAEITDVSEGPLTEAPELISKAVNRFERGGAGSKPQASAPAVRQSRDPGRLAESSPSIWPCRPAKTKFAGDA